MQSNKNMFLLDKRSFGKKPFFFFFFIEQSIGFATQNLALCYWPDCASNVKYKAKSRGFALWNPL